MRASRSPHPEKERLYTIRVPSPVKQAPLYLFQQGVIAQAGGDGAGATAAKLDPVVAIRG
jgi:hypothetical protein